MYCCVYVDMYPPHLLPEVQVAGLVVLASMWGTVTTISPTNPLIRWPELAKSNLGGADEGQCSGGEKREGGGGRGHRSVRVNQGTRKLPSLDCHRNARGSVDCCVAKTQSCLQKDRHKEGSHSTERKLDFKHTDTTLTASHQGQTNYNSTCQKN